MNETRYGPVRPVYREDGDKQHYSHPVAYEADVLVGVMASTKEPLPPAPQPETARMERGRYERVMFVLAQEGGAHVFGFDIWDEPGLGCTPEEASLALHIAASHISEGP